MSDKNWSATEGNFFFYEGDATPPKKDNSLKVGESVFLTEGMSGNKYVSSHGVKTWDEERDYLAPIPKEQILINGNLKQNPKW